MIRNIITIDEEKCNGCGKCIIGCPEGALQLINGKAKLVGDLYCDGLGACIGDCPQDAISVIQREAEEYDEFKVMENILKEGNDVIKAHLKHLKEHNQTEFYNQAIEFLKERNFPVETLSQEKDVAPLPCGCPGTMQKDLRKEKSTTVTETKVSLNSELSNWPIQLQLLSPNAPYLKNADLLIAADCTPFAYPNFHQRFLKDKVLIMFCPKLDKTLNEYVDKLATIFETQNIQSVTIVHMEVPCCSGVEMVVKKAMEKAQKIILLKDYTISISGEII